MSNQTNATTNNQANTSANDVTIEMVRDWQGSDNLSSDKLLELVTDMLNDPKGAEKTKQDILVYNEVIGWY